MEKFQSQKVHEELAICSDRGTTLLERFLLVRTSPTYIKTGGVTKTIGGCNHQTEEKHILRKERLRERVLRGNKNGGAG